MSCQWCKEGIPREFRHDYWVHTVPGSDIRACEDVEQRKVENPVTEAEKLRLYHMVDLASIIRMDHDVDIWTAIDWIKTDLLTHNTEGDPVHNVIERLLARNKHECTAACTSFRPEP